MLGKLPGRRKSNEVNQPTTNREPGDIGKIREVLRQRGHKKTDAVSHIERPSLEISTPSEDRPTKSDNAMVRAQYDNIEAQVPGEEAATIAENSAKPRFDHLSQFGQDHSDERRSRRRKRKTASDFTKKIAENGLVEGGNTDTAAKVPQSDRTTDLALVADLFHSVEWDPREFRTDMRRPDRWSHTITEAEDLDYLAMLSAHAARDGNYRS